MPHPPDNSPPVRVHPHRRGEGPAVVANGNGLPGPKLSPPRRLGFAIGVFRTFRGPHSRTARGAVSSAAGRGALAGHTAATQPREVGHEAAQASSVVRQRAARLAQRAHERARPAAEAYGSALETLGELEPRRSEAGAEISRVRRVLDKLEGELIGLERKLPATKVPPPPSPEEQATRAEDMVPGYRLHARTKAMLFAFAGSIEAIFASSMISEIANIGQVVSPAVNAALPWVVGSVIGGAIPYAAERAAHAEARAPEGARGTSAWSRRRRSPRRPRSASPARRSCGIATAGMRGCSRWRSGC